MKYPGLLSHVPETALLALLEAVEGMPIVAVASAALAPLDTTEGRSGGDQQLNTFSYTTRDGTSRELTLFVKRCAWKQRSEAVHYRHLAAAGVPTPRLYGALQNDRGEEVIFLEPLTATGFQSGSEAEWRAMLSLLAQFNACSITPDYAPHLHSFEQVGNLFGGLWVLGLSARPTKEELEGSLRACRVNENEIPELKEMARALFAAIAAQPQGLLHQDFLPNNLGWRGEREEMVVFDLHKNARGPRFADVAPYLGVPDWSDSAPFLVGGDAGMANRRERLSQHYLEQYARFGGPVVSLQTLREETAALSWAHKLAALACLADRQQQARVDEVLTFLRGHG